VGENGSDLKGVNFSEIDRKVVDRLSQEAEFRTEQPVASERVEGAQITKRAKLQSPRKARMV
jgi:hypothetical protein